MPTQRVSRNWNEASTTTINSPPDTTNGSPNKRFDKNRSITTYAGRLITVPLVLDLDHHGIYVQNGITPVKRPVLPSL